MGLVSKLIDQEYLKVGNTIYCENVVGIATITKVGRKYTYTSNPKIVINNKTFTTQPSQKMGLNRVFKSHDDYKRHKLAQVFIASVQYEMHHQAIISLDQARALNKQFNLGVEE